MKAATFQRPGETTLLVLFFMLSFGYSWCCWLSAASGLGDASTQRILLYAGIPGPLIAALLLLHLFGSRHDRRAFYGRIFQIERLSLRWWLPTLMLYPLLTTIAGGIDWLAWGAAPASDLIDQWLLNPAYLPTTLLFILLLGPVPEEPGWRGYALDRMQRLGSPLSASILLGLLWAAWHLPLFFVSGTYHHDLGLGSSGFWHFMATAIASSILITWIWLHNDRSVFAAILFHASLNLSREVVILTERGELLRTGLLILVTLMIVYRYRPIMLKRAATQSATHAT